MSFLAHREAGLLLLLLLPFGALSDGAMPIRTFTRS